MWKEESRVTFEAENCLKIASLISLSFLRGFEVVSDKNSLFFILLLVVCNIAQRGIHIPRVQLCVLR